MASDAGAAAFSWHDPGVLYAIAQADKEQDLPVLREALLNSVETAADAISPEEVERAKGQLAKRRELAMKDVNRIGVTLSDWASKGDWRLFFLHRDRVAQVQPEDVARIARQYLQPSNRTVGLFVPHAPVTTARPDTEPMPRTPVPPVTDLAAALKDYTGRKDAGVARGEFFDPSPVNIEKRTHRGELPSGMKLALLAKKSRGEAVVLEITLRCGNATSLLANTSATTLLPLFLMRGTSKYTRQQLEDELDRLQVRISPSGVLGEVSYAVECKLATVPAVLAILEEILRRPTFPADEFDVIKRQTRDSLECARTDPQSLAGRALQRKLTPFPKEHIRYVPTVEESLQRLEATSCEQVKRLYEEQVGGTAGEVVLVGDFDAQPVTATLGALLAGWQAPVPYQRIERPAVANIAGETVTIETPDKANAVYSAGLTFALKDTDPDYAPLVVGNFLFGGSSLSSRLGNRVRQKEGLSYGVGSQFSASGLDPAARFALSAIGNPSTADKLAGVIQEELTRLLDEGVHEQELSEAKDAYLKQMKIRRAGDEQLAAILQEGLYEGKTLAFHAELETHIAGLTVEQVNAALRQHLDPKALVIVQAGDFRR